MTPAATILRTCSQCRRTRPLTDFHIAKRNHADRHRSCRDCVNAAHRRRYREQHPQQRRSYGPFLSTREWAAIEVAGRMPCRMCGAELPLSAFPTTHTHGRNRRRRDCRPCLRAKEQGDPLRRQRNHAKELKYRLRRFGLSLTEYTNLLREQANTCAICGRALGDHRRTIDHDHASGRVRGIVHNHCNLALGNAHEDPRVLIGCLQYLERHHPGRLLRFAFDLMDTTSKGFPCKSSA